MGIVKLARYLKAGEKLERLSTVLEVKVELLRTLKMGALYRPAEVCMHAYV